MISFLCESVRAGDAEFKELLNNPCIPKIYKYTLDYYLPTMVTEIFDEIESYQSETNDYNKHNLNIIKGLLFRVNKTNSGHFRLHQALLKAIQMYRYADSSAYIVIDTDFIFDGFFKLCSQISTLEYKIFQNIYEKENIEKLTEKQLLFKIKARINKLP